MPAEVPYALPAARACGPLRDAGTLRDFRMAKGDYNEDFHRLLFVNNPLPMWVFDLETGRFLAVNAEACRHYGYSEAEFLGMTIADIRPAEDVPRLDALRSLGPAGHRPSTATARTRGPRLLGAAPPCSAAPSGRT